jgi:hypothetical protein
MRRASFLVLIGVTSLVLLLGGMLREAGAQPPNDDLAARWIHARLNDWRLSLDLGPLASNDTLDRMAYDQAAFLAGLRGIPATTFIHNGRTGEGPRVRALWPDYNWPDYGIRGQVVLSEITWVGQRQDAINFWRESRIHRETVTNPWYREVGVAAVPYTNNGVKGHIYVAVLASRPNVLPALADPRAGVLYLSNETFNGGRGERMRAAQQVRLFDGDGRPLTNGWIPWAAEMPIPEGAGSAVNVLYSDGTTQVLGRASLAEGDVLLPAYEEAWRVQAALTALGLPTPAPTNTPTPPPPPRIRLVYDAAGLTLLNVSPTAANISRLRLLGDAQELRVADLTVGYLRGSLRALPPFNCLIYGLDSRRRSTPLECRYTSVTFALPRELFWNRADFTVMNGNERVAACVSDEGLCEFDLP